MKPEPSRNWFFIEFQSESLDEASLASLVQAKTGSDKFSLKQKLGRIILNILFRIIPLNQQLMLLDVIKQRRSGPVHQSPATFFISTLIGENKISIQPAYPDQREFFIGLTFDIDNKIDYHLLPDLVEDLVKHGLTATINLVTHTDYKISSSLVTDLQKSGFEIGLHGDTHNSALAFLPKPIIKAKLQRAVDRLGFIPYGYRTPGLSFSPDLVTSLDELGFVYDSSLTTGIAMYRSIEFPYVFRFPGSRLLEVPLFMQDYNFFVNDLYSEEAAVAVFAEQLAEIKRINGVAVINLHPIMIHHRKLFRSELIRLLLSYKDTANISTIYDLVKHIG
ncbi:MAG: polysaccharide deacetylase family protein [Deltaproteobacteria bacterium]|nr:polysaccharide deacetylase family protein [Deltaproteobacteria bacterium]